MYQEFDAVIVANGEFPTHPIPLKILRGASHLVACDGAVASLAPVVRDLSALVVIGDGDSVPGEFRQLLIKVDEQDDNDLTKATRYCLSQGWQRIAYLAATGKREDHALGNISLLMRYYRDLAVEGVMLTDYGWFTPCKGNRQFAAVSRQQVSIFNFGSTQIVSDGLRWPAYACQELWQGTLNEALSDRFSICSDGFYMVYQTYDIK